MDIKYKKYFVVEEQRNKRSKRKKERKEKWQRKKNKERKNGKEGMFITPMNLVYTCRL